MISGPLSHDGDQTKELTMNECEFSGQLGTYHDGELSPSSRAQIEEHLARCPACAAELSRLRALSERFSAMTPAALPPDMLERLHRSTDRLPALTICRIAEAVAAVAAGILIACLIGISRQGPSEASAYAPPVWETKAAAIERAEGSEEQFATWVAQDLSGKGNHD